jgi:hypothetical protein
MQETLFSPAQEISTRNKRLTKYMVVTKERNGVTLLPSACAPVICQEKGVSYYKHVCVFESKYTVYKTR